MQENAENAINEVSAHKYTQILNANLTTKEITLPASYKVGANVLDIFCNGIRLTKANASDSEGHYYEVGEQNNISNKIKLATDWFNDTEQRPAAGDVFEIVIRR